MPDLPLTCRPAIVPARAPCWSHVSISRLTGSHPVSEAHSLCRARARQRNDSFSNIDLAAAYAPGRRKDLETLRSRSRHHRRPTDPAALLHPLLGADESIHAHVLPVAMRRPQGLAAVRFAFAATAH